MVKLTDLIGLHRLQGFDTSIPNKKIDDWEEADEGICFILDDKKYQIYCDPSDGYRSYLTDLYTDESVKCSNCFKDKEVFIVDASKLQKDCNSEGIVILSMTGKIIGKIITDYSDSWYPCARVEWHPKNLSDNEVKQLESTDLNYMVSKTRTHGLKLEMNGRMLASMLSDECGLKETISIGIGYDKELRVDTKIKTITYVDNKTHEETILDYITLQER